MFDRSIGRFKINNEEVPIFYKNGKFFLSFRKLRNAVNDYAEKKCDRVLKRIGLKEDKDYFRDTVKGETKIQYFIIEDSIATYMDSLKHLGFNLINEYINIVENNIIKYKNLIEENREYVTEENAIEDPEDGDITDIEDRSYSVDRFEKSDNVYDDTEECDSYVAQLLTNMSITDDNIVQRLNELDRKVEYIHEEVEALKKDNILNMKIMFEALSILLNGQYTILKKNNFKNISSQSIGYADICVNLSNKYYDMLSDMDKVKYKRARLVR